MNPFFRLVLAAAVAVMAFSPIVALADGSFNLTDLYSQDHRRWLDSDCGPARAAAEILSKPDPAVTADQAVDFQKAFVACGNAKMKTVGGPDMDKVKYASLAAAGAAFEEALVSTGARRDAAMTRGYQWADNLSATSAGNTLITRLNSPIDNGSGADAKATLGGGGPVAGNGPTSGRDSYVTSRNPFGANVNWLFGGDAAKLRDAFADMIKTRTLQQAPAPAAPAK